MHFSSVFTREDTSSIPVPETKFKGSEGERLGQLVVTPEVVVSKINNMKESKSPGVDGISPKILKETVEQKCINLFTHMMNLLSYKVMHVRPNSSRKFKMAAITTIFNNLIVPINANTRTWYHSRQYDNLCVFLILVVLC